MINKFLVKVNSTEVEFHNDFVTAAEVLNLYREKTTTVVNVLVQLARGGVRTILSGSDSIDLSQPGIERFEAFDSNHSFKFNVNHKLFITQHSSLSVAEILEIAGLFPVEDYKLSLSVDMNENEVLSREKMVNFSAHTVLNFRADLKDHIYTISVDGVKHVLSSRKVTKEQILLVAGKTPVSNFELIQKLQDKRRLPITDGMWVDLSAEDAEKFVTIPCDQTEGAR